jgi:8-oxo-dGTP pyrophosphatase MutT (NUDIX family)
MHEVKEISDNFIDQLSDRLSGPLPGRPAQFKMASMRRLEELGDHVAAPDHAVVACVLNLLHWHQGEWCTVLIQRTINPKDRHSGQVSFPGGRYEESDGDLTQVALREAEEEIGVSPALVEIIGRLTELYIPVSNFVVHPFVGVLRGHPEFRPQPGEVQSILTPPIRTFAAAGNRKTTDLTLAQGVTIKNVPYFDVEGRIVWGATAMILSEFMEIIDAGY